MKMPQDIELIFGEEVFKIKSYLTFEEIGFIVQKSIQAYDEGLLQDDNVVAYTDKIQGFNKNLLCVDFAFNTLLSSLVCEDFKEVDYDILLNNSVFDELILQVNGARYAYESIKEIINKKSSLEYQIGQGIEKLIAKLPDSKELQKLSKSLIKDLNNPKNGETIDRIKDIFDMKKNKIV